MVLGFEVVQGFEVVWGFEGRGGKVRVRSRSMESVKKLFIPFICQKIVYFLKSEYMLIGKGRLRRIRDLVPINTLVYIYIHILI